MTCSKSKSLSTETAPMEETMTLRNMRSLYATLIVSVFVFSLTIVASVQPAAAQSTGSATLRGTVKDPQGADCSWCDRHAGERANQR